MPNLALNLLPRIILLILFLVCGSPISVSNAQPTINPGKIFLVSETQSISNNTKIIWIGIHHKLKKDWHTYWRYAGDSGLPIKINWSKVSNANIGGIRWPMPTVFKTRSLVSYGYKDEVLLLIPLTIRRYGPIRLSATVEWLVCREICIQQRSNLEIEIPLGNGRKNAKIKKLFERARSTIPVKLPYKANATVYENQITLKLNMPKIILQSIHSVMFLPSLDGMIENSKQQIWNSQNAGSDNHLKIQMTAGYGLSDGLKNLDGTIILGTTAKNQYKRRAFDISNIPLFNKPQQE